MMKLSSTHKFQIRGRVLYITPMTIVAADTSTKCCLRMVQ
ncbi:hypothetical protein KC19_5G163300 [Ceratodon purpureus]|uniref:Uncharacterized protein n=1 Tax=Ceratodon purpureus TaxID=3225 RepID=A0A8T0I437_CERPU|nr:hypothetical protein KC19_5G163300 [Ceratodon purpureus]